LRFLAPSTLSPGCVHYDTDHLPGTEAPNALPARRGLASAAPFRLRRFYDLDGFLRTQASQGLPWDTLLGFLPSRVSPDPESARPLPVRPPLMTFAAPLLPVAGVRGPCDPVHLQGLELEVDRGRRFPVSCLPGLDPLMGFLVGPS